MNTSITTELAGQTAGADSNFATPSLAFFADLDISVGTPQEVGSTAQGLKRVIPIVGGTAIGVGWTAQVFTGTSVRLPHQVLLRFFKIT